MHPVLHAGIPLKHLAVAICCGLTESGSVILESGSVILDPTLAEEKKLQAFAYLVFPNSPLSILHKSSSNENEPIEPIERGLITSVTHGAMSGKSFVFPIEPIELGLITSVTHGAMSVLDYFSSLERGRAACTKISEFLRRSFQSQVSEDSSKAT